MKLIGMVIGTEARIFTEICTSDQCVGPLIGGGRSWRRERGAADETFLLERASSDTLSTSTPPGTTSSWIKLGDLHWK